MKLAAIVMAFAATLAHAGGFNNSDSWTGNDKAQHAYYSAAIGLAAGSMIEDKKTAFFVAMVPGIAKEIYDYHHNDKHSASYKDLAADALGAAVGVYVGNCIIRHNSFVCHYEF